MPLDPANGAGVRSDATDFFLRAPYGAAAALPSIAAREYTPQVTSSSAQGLSTRDALGPADKPQNDNCMKTRIALQNRFVLAAIVAAAFTVAAVRPAYADDVTPPPVPDKLKVDAGNDPFLVGHATGTQNYVCAPTANGVGYVLFTPEAIPSNGAGREIITHFFSPNPFVSNTNPGVIAPGVIRASWQHSRDASSVWGFVDKDHASSDPAFVAPNSIAWLLVTAENSEDGPDGNGTLTGTTFIHRVNTQGGLAPSTGCSSSADLGRTAFVPYTADYFFYRHSNAAN
jgi:Protein of unknown function (DUF3455)